MFYGNAPEMRVNAESGVMTETELLLIMRREREERRVSVCEIEMEDCPGGVGRDMRMKVGLEG